MEAEFCKILGTLQVSGGELLDSFQRDIELFRRPSLMGTSVLLDGILNRNQSPRLSRWVESRCRHSSTHRRIVARLSNSLRDLQNHVDKVRENLEKLEVIVDDTTSRLPKLLDDQASPPDDDMDPANKPATHATLMALVYSMFRDDYEMKARIVGDLGYETPSEVIQNYCTMWSLRAFIDDKVMTAAVRWFGGGKT